jgi:hypothetical protein
MGMKIRHRSPLAAACNPVRFGELHAGARWGGLTSMSTDDGREKTGTNIATPKQDSQRTLHPSFTLTASTV